MTSTSPELVINRFDRLWFLRMFAPALTTSLVAFVVSVAGGLVQIAISHRIDAGTVLSSSVAIAVIVFAMSNGRPTEVRVTPAGVRVTRWSREFRWDSGRFFEPDSQARLVMIASGSYISAPGREPVRLHIPRFAMSRLARVADLPLERRASWWTWNVLAVPGLFLWWAAPPIGASMLLFGLALKMLSFFRDGRADLGAEDAE